MGISLILTEREVKFLVEALDVRYARQKEKTPENLKKYINLRHYLMTRERR